MPCVEFRRESAVSDIIGGPDGVAIALSSGEQLAASYVVGADGARSVVRKAIGATTEGVTDQTPFIIVDVDEHPDGSTPMVGMFHYSCPELDGRNVMHMPFATGMRIVRSWPTPTPMSTGGSCSPGRRRTCSHRGAGAA